MFWTLVVVLLLVAENLALGICVFVVTAEISKRRFKDELLRHVNEVTRHLSNHMPPTRVAIIDGNLDSDEDDSADDDDDHHRDTREEMRSEQQQQTQTKSSSKFSAKQRVPEVSSSSSSSSNGSASGFDSIGSPSDGEDDDDEDDTGGTHEGSTATVDGVYTITNMGFRQLHVPTNGVDFALPSTMMMMVPGLGRGMAEPYRPRKHRRGIDVDVSDLSSWTVDADDQ